MSLVYPVDTKNPSSSKEQREKSVGDGFPTSPYFQNLLATGQTCVKDISNGQIRCIIRLPNGNHCGRNCITENDGTGNRTRCPVDHKPYDPKNVMSVELREKLGRQIRQEDGVKSSKAVKENAPVEIVATKDGIQFVLSLEDLGDKDLVNVLLTKISAALEDVPTDTMGKAKRVMKLQEAVEKLKK